MRRVGARCRTLGVMNVRRAEFRFHDGPGGGPVDTGIVIHPGDAVTLSATGTILPGAFLGVRTSPEMKLKGEWAGDSSPAEPGLVLGFDVQAVAVSSTW